MHGFPHDFAMPQLFLIRIGPKGHDHHANCLEHPPLHTEWLLFADSKKSRVRMLDDALFAKLLDRSIAIQGDRAILNVQELQATTKVGYALDAFVADHLTTFYTQLAKAR